MKSKHLTLFFLVFLFSIFVARTAFAENEVLKIKDIEIKGHSKVAESTIRFHVKSKPGDDFSVEKLREDLKGIYNLGFFKDVKIDVQDFEGGLKVIFVVMEKPFINKIIISGHKKIKEDDIREQLSLKENVIYNKNLLKESVEKISILYQSKGYLFVEINSREIEIDPNRVDLEIHIDEGQKMGIDKITFTGNKSFTEKELRKAIDTKEKNFFSFITKKGSYIKEILKDDRLRVKEFYYNHGYIQAHIGEPRVEMNKATKEIYVTIPVIEGDQFKVGELNFSGDPEVSEKEMRKKLSLKKGSVFSRKDLKGDIDELTDLYAQKGYALVDIAPRTKTDLEKKLVDVTFDVDKGKRVFVGSINIEGNERTRDNVIRRNFKLSEGEVFDSEKLRKSKRGLDFTGFFSDVEIDTSRSDKDDMIDIDARVKETETGTITFGGGYSTTENLIFGGSVFQNNFMGGGQRLGVATYLSGVSTQFKISYDDPALFDSAVGFFTSLYNKNEDFLYFDRDSNGGNLGFRKQLMENVVGSLNYKFEEIEVSNINPDITSQVIRSQLGTTTTSSLRPRITRDTRNRRFYTTEGSISSLDFELAGGPFGGNNDFYRSNASVTKFLTVWKEKGLVLAQRGSVGLADSYGGEDLPIFERYFAGGTTTLRGYKYHEIGPQDAGEAVGGNSRLLLSSELRYPLLDQMNVTAIGFFDAGNVFKDINDLDPFTLRTSVGPGIRLFSPIGPMGFEYGFKINPRPDETAGSFHFRVGAGF